ncbi:MAG: EscF/YscF/HrpA family type III secretion system needle major subunit [Desulfovibrio sp.]|nr:EscF/YscF/HrpA family type III secretion system needle major subunit [Desulfovibrio sp.]
MSDVSGIDIGALFRNATSSLDTDGKALQSKIDSISQKGDVDQSELLQLQYAMGQYNAKLESISSVVKSLQDMLKSLAQRTG